MAVVLLGTASVGAALVFREPSLLSCLLFIIPLCGLFYCLDARVLSNWRSRLLEVWSTGTIDFSALLAALRVAPNLPGETLAAMLRTLPGSGTLQAEHEIPSKSRRAIAAVARAVDDYHSDVVALKTCGASLAVLSSVCAVILTSWRPLLFVSVALFAPLLAGRLRRLRLTRAAAAILATQLDPILGYPTVERVAIALEWSPMSNITRDEFIAELRSQIATRAGIPI